MVISSKDNELIKEIKKLKEKKYRDESGLFFVEGIKVIKESLVENIDIKYIFIEEKIYNNSQVKEIVAKVDNKKIIIVTEKVFKIISDVSNPQGILAVIKMHNYEKNDIDFNSKITLILDDLQDPGNMGTIIRTADSLKLSQIIVSKNTVDIYNPKVIRSTMGAIFRIKIIRVDDLVGTIKDLQENNITVYGTDLKTNDSIYNVEYLNSAIVIGNEANGVSKEVLNVVNSKIKIPMLGTTESLNAAVATSIILYEAHRKTGLIK